MPCIVTPARTTRPVVVARRYAGLSRRELAERTGITLPRIVALETSELPLDPTEAECDALALATEVRPHFFQLGDIEVGLTFMCGEKLEPETFCRCGEEAEFLCDGVYLGGTCDEPLCEDHATIAAGDDRHLCARCAGG
jgi:hypothetical protein